MVTIIFLAGTTAIQFGGGADDDIIDGGADDDWLGGDDGEDTIIGGSGNDFIEGGAGADWLLDGGEGDDKIYANVQSLNTDNEIDILVGGLGNDFLYGSGGGDILNGGGGYDYLSGKNGDFLYGEEGEDQLYGIGAVTMDGGDGNDYLSGSGEGVMYVKSSGVDVIYDNGLSSTLNLGSSVVSLFDTEFFRASNNSLIISTSTGSVIVRNHFGSNPLEYIQFQDISLSLENVLLDVGVEYLQTTLEEAAGTNNYYVTKNFSGSDEDNTYNAIASGNVVSSGLGKNTFIFDNNNDGFHTTISSSVDEFQDVIRIKNVSSINDVQLVYENFDMALYFGTSSITIEDVTNPGQSNHYVVQVPSAGGLYANYTLYDLPLTIKGRHIDGGVSGFSSNNILYAYEDDSYLNGGAGNDQLYGASGNDELYGGVGNDVIDGGDGDDLIYGNSGADLLIDSSGNDTYYVDVSDTVRLGAGANTIVRDTALGGSSTLSGLRACSRSA